MSISCFISILQSLLLLLRCSLLAISLCLCFYLPFLLLFPFPNRRIQGTKKNNLKTETLFLISHLSEKHFVTHCRKAIFLWIIYPLSRYIYFILSKFSTVFFDCFVQFHHSEFATFPSFFHHFFVQVCLLK